MTDTYMAQRCAGFNPAQQDTDTVVVLHCEHHFLAKQYWKGTWIAYDQGYLFDARTGPVADLDALGRLLVKLDQRPHCCIIRGEPIAGGDRLHNVRRLGPDNGDASVFKDTPHSWIALDLDSIELSPQCDPFDLRACVADIAPRLLPPFQGVRCLAQATSGHTFKPGARLRLWYWLSRPLTSAECKRWLKSIGAPQCILDLLQPVSPHYTAAPLFIDGSPDPLPRRLIGVPGKHVVDVPDGSGLAPPPETPRSYLEASGRLTEDQRHGIINKLLNATEGSRNRLLHWSAARFGEAIYFGTVDETLAEEILIGCADQMNPRMDAREAKATVRSGIAAGKRDAALQGFTGE